MTAKPEDTWDPWTGNGYQVKTKEIGKNFRLPLII
jgi:hypothetical protein